MLIYLYLGLLLYLAVTFISLITIILLLSTQVFHEKLTI